MNVYKLSLVFLLLFHKKTFATYSSCLLGTGQQAPLLLQNGLRCIQAQPELKTTWDESMDLCNSRKGHLLHVYSSEEAKAIHNWIIERSLPANPYIGQKKIGVHNETSNYTASNAKWFISTTEDIGFEQYYQYHQYTPLSSLKYTNFEYGVTRATNSGSTNKTTWGYGSYTILDGGRGAICQFLADKPPTKILKAERGKRSLAPFYKSSEKKNERECGRKCMKEPWCMGFNAVGNANGVTCQMIAVKQMDTDAGMIEDSEASYYERFEG